MSRVGYVKARVDTARVGVKKYGLKKSESWRGYIAGSENASLDIDKRYKHHD